MIAVAGLLVLAILGQPQPHTYRWRDDHGQVQITNTPPPPGAEVLEAPPPQAVEPGHAGRPEMLRQSANRGGRRQALLSPAQQQAWEALNQRLARARAEGDRPTLEAVTDSLIYDCLWGNGLWAMPVLPLLSVALMGLLGWWLALGFRTGPKLPLVAGFLLLGAAFGHLALNVFLYHPQAVRLRQNLELLEQHMGTDRALRPEHRTLLQQRYVALEQAAEPLQAPWRFPAEVKALRQALKQVMVEP
ncbi:MAG: DUF4124 domain-containing protein [Geothrix sp.]|uniref:DUF4124 domain-containing protein n=1 Tax=Geothrix sp. TaxID=1962974 RepID=UPI00180979FA|nr:DUF4124 domain-containing protein [Geothrix sp.]NWJ40924.1 DUF4124 domain-containing protein [Geothrix sp.]WIL21076.1 MAG: DUF4124 domain-containing protein [Geothrix sp.]